MKKTLLFFSVLIVLTLTGCFNPPIIPTGPLSLTQIRENAHYAISHYTIEQIDQNLNELAILFAQFVNSDRGMKNHIYLQVGQQFDGDYNALFEVIADLKYNKRTLRESLYQLAKANKKEKTLVLLPTVPYLNLAIPVNYDQWNSYEGQIYVIPLSYKKDDLSITTLIGYDGEGNTRAFDLTKKPEYPVLVLGINERFEMIEAKKEAATSGENLTLLNTFDGLRSVNENLDSIYFNTALEPWPFGAPEPYVLVVAGENELVEKIDIEFASTTKNWIPLNQNIFSITNTPNHRFFWIEVREHDGLPYRTYPVAKNFTYEQNYPVTATYALTERVGAGDDTYGESFVNYWHTQGQYFWLKDQSGAANAVVILRWFATQ